MLNVYFESDKEVIYFCESLFSYYKQIELKWKTDEDWGNLIQFRTDSLNNDLIEAMGKAMVDVFKAHQLSTMMKQIIETDYYYTNSEEIERILDLSHALVQEGVEDDKFEDKPLELLLSSFISNLKHTTQIHYDSVIKFRMQLFKKQLKHYVGLAIDEYKHEEEHQAFIDMLRKFIANKKAIYDEIHILQGDQFLFFKSTGKAFSKLEIRTLMYDEPLYMVGLGMNELNLAPLVAIAPKKIHIYGDNPSEPKTLTVINVFQEKVQFKSTYHFPFPHYLPSH